MAHKIQSGCTLVAMLHIKTADGMCAYDLVGCIQHAGEGVHSGHHFAVVKDRDKKGAWWKGRMHHAWDPMRIPWCAARAMLQPYLMLCRLRQKYAGDRLSDDVFTTLHGGASLLHACLSRA